MFVVQTSSVGGIVARVSECSKEKLLTGSLLNASFLLLKVNLQISTAYGTANHNSRN